MVPLTSSRGGLYTKRRASIDVRHLNVTLPVVIIVRTQIYRICANIKVCDNNIRKCPPFAKFTKMIDREYFAKSSI